MTNDNKVEAAAAAHPEGATSRPRGRRPGDPEKTRTAILAAARRQFAEAGFIGSSVRAVARSANIDPALVTHHFGTKRELFLAAHNMPSNPIDLIGPALAAPRAKQGETLARSFLERFLHDPTQVGVSLIRCAASDSEAAGLLREKLDSALAGQALQLMPHASENDARTRSALISSILVGAVFHAKILQLEPLASADTDEIARKIGPAIQAMLDLSKP